MPEDLFTWLVGQLSRLQLDIEVRKSILLGSCPDEGRGRREDKRGRMLAWFRERTNQICLCGVNLKVYSSYTMGIMSDDEDLPLEDRVQSVVDLLSSSTDEDLGTFGQHAHVMEVTKTPC